MPTLYLIDGYAQFFRAYHAIKSGLTSPVTKEPTNMTFGFVGMLLKLLRAEGPALRDARPTHLAVVLDVSGDRGTFRSQLYPQYKAHRKPPPEDLEPQVQRCVRLLKEVGVPVLGSPGFEADDVLATLVTRLRDQSPDLRIRIVSKDKDLKQLLEPGSVGANNRERVELFDVHTDAAFDSRTLQVELGIAPTQIIDWLALMGDTSDNVPGVPGVGEKTAALLIKEHGSLDKVLQNAEKIAGKRGEAIRASRDLLGLSRQLVTLERNTPVGFSLADAETSRLDLAKLIPICKELGFNRYQDEVRAVMTLMGKTPPDKVSGANAPTSPTTNGSAPRGSKPQADMPISIFNQPANSSAPHATSARKTAPASGSAGPTGGLFESVSLASASPTKAQAGTYHCITTKAQLESLIARCKHAEVVSVDTETTGLNPRDAKLCGVSLAINAGEGYYIPTLSPTPNAHLSTQDALALLRPLLEDPTVPKCGHNLKYDLLIFRNHGVALRGVAESGGFDSMVASYLVDASRASHGLDSLALALLGRTNISITELIGSGKDQRTFDTVPLDAATQYAAEDADVALQLRGVMLPQLRAMELMDLFTRVEMPLVEALADLEWNGILCDPSELDRQRTRLEREITSLLKQIDSASKSSLRRTFDPDSPKQLAAVLFNAPDDEVPGLGLKGAKRTKTGFSTDAEVLEGLAEDPEVTTPLPRLILEYRQLAKLVSTYLVALKQAIHPATGRIHSSFHQTVAATGRLASSDPNLQNIPIRSDVGREIRRAFLAPPGRVLVSADYSQIELRLLAHLSKDPALIEAFHKGEDIHTAVAAQIAGKAPKDVTRDERSGAKMVNFGIVYGITPFGLARRLKVEQSKAAEIIDAYKRRFSGITTFLQECVEQATSRGYVTTILGRRRPIPDITSSNPSRRALAERLAINSVVQGSAADLIKLAMVNIRADLIAANAQADAAPSSSSAQAKKPAKPTAKAPTKSATKSTAALAGDAANPLAGTLMLLQIHDELVFECPQEHAPLALEAIQHRMEHAMELLVPLQVDAHISANWFDGK